MINGEFNIQSKTSKLQKIILIYVGVVPQSNNKKYMKRKDVTIGLADLFDRYIDNNFSAIVSQSFRGLKNKNLISKRGCCVGLTTSGRKLMEKIIDNIIEMYGEITWDVIKDFYFISSSSSVSSTSSSFSISSSSSNSSS